MTTENIQTMVMTAENGYYFTQVADVPLAERIVASKVALSKFSTIDDWKEISKEEGDQIIAEQNAARTAELPTE